MFGRIIIIYKNKEINFLRILLDCLALQTIF